MLLKESTKNIQSKLADYCRTGELALTTEVNQKHVRHYRRLVYNIIDDILESAFPIFFQYASDKLWDGMVSEFFSNHNCQTPQVWKLPGEFYEYACKYNWKEKHQLPWLEDLLLFEWIELDIHTMEDEEFPDYRVEGDKDTDLIAINPEYRILSVAYPVHKVAPSDLEDSMKGQYFILIFRQPETGSVQFLDISVLHAITIEKIEEGKTLSVIIDELQQAFNLSDKKEVQSHLHIFLNDLSKKGFVLGSRV